MPSSYKSSVTAIFVKKIGTPPSIAADGKEKYPIIASALYALGGATAEGVTLDMNISGGDASQLHFWWDEVCAIPIVNNAITIGQAISGVAGPGWRLRTIYMTCTAHADCKYTVVAVPRWPNYQIDGAAWSFTAPAAVPPRNFTIVSTNGGANITTLIKPALSTPLVVQLLDIKNGQPLANAQISGQLVWRGTSITAGTVIFDLPYTDQKGIITLSAFPDRSGNITLQLNDDISGGQGSLDLAANVLLTISISAQPEPVTDPGKVTFTAMIANDRYQVDPSNILLKWIAGDELSSKYFAGSQLTTTLHDDQSTFQYSTAAAVEQGDLASNDAGQISAQLLIYGTDTPFGLGHEVPFNPNPSLLGPPPPIPLLAYIITDDVLTAARNLGGVPFLVKGPQDAPIDGSGYVMLYGHIIPGPLQPDPGGDLPVTGQFITNRQDIKLYAPVEHEIFNQNGDVDLYYQLVFGNDATSQVLRVIVDRGSRKNGPPPDPGLMPPIPSTVYYNKTDYDSNEPLAVTVEFGGMIKAQAGDMIVVHLDLTGIAANNMNRSIPMALDPFVFAPNYLSGQNADDVMVKFDGVNGDPQGFPSTAFQNMGLFEGELYFIYVPRSGKTLRSPSTWLQLDTLLDGQILMAKTAKRMARRSTVARSTVRFDKALYQQADGS
jgi:hypothetical protein